MSLFGQFVLELYFRFHGPLTLQRELCEHEGHGLCEGHRRSNNRLPHAAIVGLFVEFLMYVENSSKRLRKVICMLDWNQKSCCLAQRVMVGGAT